MSYEKQNWKNGDVITEAKLNHMEDGIATGGGVLVVHGAIDGNTMTLDHTWQEIYDADAGAAIMRYEDSGFKNFCMLESVGEESGDYICDFGYSSGKLTFTTDNPNGYPVATQG